VGIIPLLPDQLRSGEGYLGCWHGPGGLCGGSQAGGAADFLPGSEGGGFGQNDAAPPTFIAWRGQEQAAYCLEAALAALAVVAMKRWHVTKREAPPALRDSRGGGPHACAARG